MPLDLTKPVTTRDGRAVTIVKTDLKTTTGYTILGYVTAEDGTHEVRVWDPQGAVSFGRETRHDLVNKSVKFTGWVNIFSHNPEVAMIYPTRKDADYVAKKLNYPRLACLEFSYEKGQGL